ncbi:MAG: hypothetical protein EXR86_00020 [Gammaproteobacteria bacterium]|nr:hypothetical protein [Gammaproteobacteria bacterium]
MTLAVSLSSRADSLDEPLPLAPTASSVHGVETCAGPPAETPLRAEQGSSGVMYNFAEHPKSIRAVAKKLLTAAVDASAEAQKSACDAAPCASENPPSIVFRVAPITLLPANVQQPLCLQLAERTSKLPLKYGTHEFPSVEKFDEWITQFSLGQGPDGKLLYEQCGGNCDPSYTFIIAPGEMGLKVNTEVYCGFARDRKDEMFALSTTLRHQCGHNAR